VERRRDGTPPSAVRGPGAGVHEIYLAANHLGVSFTMKTISNKMEA
jgi:hypothetical protein